MRIATIIGSALLLSACNFTAGAQENDEGAKAERRDYQVGGFDRLSLAGAYDVVVTVGGQPSVRAEGDPKQLERLEVKVVNGELQIGSQEKFHFGWKAGRRPVTLYVTAPSLSAASLAGSGDLRIDKVEGKSFAASIAGSGDIDVGALKVETASFSVGGSGTIKAAGSAQGSDVSIAGSGDLDLAGLEARRAKVSVAGSGNVRARATETADISIMGSGDVELSGGAKCNISKMGSGAARCVA